MQRQARPNEIEHREFEAAVEDLRLQAFRIYESVRATQRERDVPLADRTRSLSAAAALAVELVEDVRRISWDVAAAGEHDEVPTAQDAAMTYRPSEFARSAF
jgi:hypothetical protein